jgi:hypothetical protein
VTFYSRRDLSGMITNSTWPVTTAPKKHNTWKNLLPVFLNRCLGVIVWLNSRPCLVTFKTVGCVPPVAWEWKVRYHVVILLLKSGSNKWVNKLGSTFQKYRATLALKLFEPILLWKWLYPPIFLDLVSRSDRTIFCTIYRCLLDVNKLLRNQISLRQHVFYDKGIDE